MYRFIYKYYFAAVKSVVSGFRSTILEPDDIFQEGLIAASLNVEKGKFNGDSSFQTYLVSICRNICLKKLSRYKRMVTTNIEDYDVVEEAYGFPEEQINRMLGMKAMLDSKCREIINLRFGLSDKVDHPIFPVQHTTSPVQELSGNSNIRFEEISTILGLEPDNARQRFKRCIDKLRTLMVTDHSLKMVLTNP